MPTSLRDDLIAFAALTVAVAALYLPTLGVPWYCDDFAAIVNNPRLHELGRALVELDARRWIAMFSFALNYHFGGSAVTGYHIVNLLIHLAAAGVAYLLLKRVFPGRPRVALWAALLFALHPVQTQAVTYIVQRMASLCGLWFLTALYLFVRARETLAAGTPPRSRGHLVWYGAALGAGAIAVFTKENAVVLPAALYLFERSFLDRSAPRRRLLLYLTPFVFAPLLLAGLSLIAPLASGDPLSQVTGFYRHGLSTPLRYLVTEFSVLWIYLRLLVLPFGQALDYGYPLVEQLFNWRSTLALAGLIALAAGAWRLRQRRPRLAFAVAWFFLTLAVESSLFPLDPLVEHRLYLPLFAAAVAAGDLLLDLADRRWRRALAGIILLWLALLTWQRNRLWQDPFAFYADNLRHAPQAQLAWSNLFGRYVFDGRLTEAEALLSGSNYAFYDSYLALARAYLKRGELPRARELATTARDLNPALPQAYLVLADTALQAGDRAQARAALTAGLAVQPQHNELRQRLAALGEGDAATFADALTLYRQGDAAAALRAFVALAQREPNNARALFNAGAIAFELGNRAALAQLLGRLRIVDPAAAAELEQQTRSR